MYVCMLYDYEEEEEDDDDDDDDLRSVENRIDTTQHNLGTN